MLIKEIYSSTIGSVSCGLKEVGLTHQPTIHEVTGVLAIVLMLFHAVWATWVLYKNDENKKAVFHKFSIAVWLVPYIIGCHN